MWWRAEIQDLHRLTDRLSTVYVERTHIDRDENAVVLINKERTVRVPAALVAVVLLGPGTRITHAAVNLLADSGTAICWVGEHGVRCYANGLGPGRSTALLYRQAYLVTRRSERLDVARRMYARRFPGEDVSTLTMQQLRGREGTRIRNLYRAHAQRTGVQWNGRMYRAGEPFATGDDVNRLLSAAHSCLYGICHAAIVGIGASPGLGFVHTGGALSFVLDIADLYKAEYTIPLAFDLTANGHLEERDARLAFRDKVRDGRLLHRVIADVADLLAVETGSPDEEGQHELWDERVGSVAGGTDWSARADPEGLPPHVVITGPELGSESLEM
jgi:CRISPR-associated protein Cas1